jgi:hypothetical protein
MSIALLPPTASTGILLLTPAIMIREPRQKVLVR